MCENPIFELPRPNAKYFGTLNNLPPENFYSSELCSQVLFQDLNNLRDIHIMQIVVEDT